MSNVVSFVEESCFSGDTFRQVRRQVMFTVHLFNREFREDLLADNGLFYDYTDEYLVAHLDANFPDIEWGRYIFHKKIDFSAIEILCPDSQKIIGSIHVRRARKPNLSGEIVGGNVMVWAEVQSWKEERERKRERKAKD